MEIAGDGDGGFRFQLVRIWTKGEVRDDVMDEVMDEMIDGVMSCAPDE